MADVELSTDIPLSCTLTGPLACAYSVAVMLVGSASVSAELYLNPNLSVEVVARAAVSADLTVGDPNLAVNMVGRAELVLPLSVDRGLSTNIPLSGSIQVSLGSDIPMSATLPGAAVINADLSTGRQAIGVAEVIQEILSLWGLESSCNALDWVKARAMNDLNASMQILWSQSEDSEYFSRQTLTLTFAPGVSSLDLDDSIQSVVGSARVPTHDLVALGSRGEFDNFKSYYLGGTNSQSPQGTPMAYFIERLNKFDYDSVKNTFHVTPTPDVEVNVTLGVTVESPRYSWQDFQEGSTIPIPHRYVESILLPIVRKRASSFHLFVDPERLESINAEYAESLNQVGINDPLEKEVKND